MGETAARPLIFAGGNAEGAKTPLWISPQKKPARKSQTEENATHRIYTIMRGLIILKRRIDDD
jgi:hypothetical protein